MSGTSFDGVDAALIKTDGYNYIKYLKSSFVEYTNNEKGLYFDSILKNYKKVTDIINRKHIKVIKKLLEGISVKIDVIGLHGQTFFHKPRESWTWQYVNSRLISGEFKTNVISDFRIADVNFGGEGAPLVPIFHKLLSIQNNLSYPAAILNIGGISNITIIQDKFDIKGFDIGPGNGPLDLVVKNRLNLNMDKDGDIAINGKINKKIKEKILYSFNTKFNENSFDRNLLDTMCLSFLNKLNTQDALATLIDFISELILIKTKKYRLKNIIIAGGGRKNKTLINSIRHKLKNNILIAEDIGLDGDSLEAQAFAYLAVRSLYGLPFAFKSTTGVKKLISGGVLYNSINY